MEKKYNFPKSNSSCSIKGMCMLTVVFNKTLCENDSLFKEPEMSDVKDINYRARVVCRFMYRHWMGKGALLSKQADVTF